jgi:uncharacterized protein with PIN domain
MTCYIIVTHNASNDLDINNVYIKTIIIHTKNAHLIEVQVWLLELSLVMQGLENIQATMNASSFKNLTCMHRCPKCNITLISLMISMQDNGVASGTTSYSKFSCDELMQLFTLFGAIVRW